MNSFIINFKIKLIKIYKYILSPLLGNNCRYSTPCSDYYIGSLRKHGLFKGTLLGVSRIFTCHPFVTLGGGSGFDFVPDNNKNHKGRNGQ